ncbi:benzoate/H(+) symporter BenE family transporter [Roseicyclus mahoneyensis]|uniref:Benzoate membrane transport protein n=1 Tax=Roseicyclus mahoneyensis TaxID=164332 RepID=A0A316GZQ2_9RHOB|nr:benzoate/H(+) symporter BenE family transporter [Roseicyclus mahoneyensis]PWK60629.1 benzoate membrane transport protein [Roseicyclus mahoneyensis]
MKASLVTSALVAVVVGFGGSVAVVIAAADSLGATEAQKASWITVLCLSMAVGSAWLSWRSKMPVVLAWSTPGAALIAASSGIDMEQAVGAFLVAAALIVLTGVIQPLGRLAARIPAPLATALLAGVLFSFVAGAAVDSVALPALGLPMVAAFLLVRLWSATWAVIAAIAAGASIVLVAGMHGTLPPVALSPPVLIVPVLDLGTALGLALPLYIVTMASQNLPGIAVLRADGYAPPVPAILTVTGALSVLTAPFGGHTTSLAAITAAICTGADAHPDPAQRWKGGIVYAAGYAGLTLIGASVVVIAASLPPELVTILAGLALLGPFMGALRAAFGGSADAFPPALTFAVTASGVSIWSVGAPFWGLAVGLLAMGLARMRKP